MSDVPKKKYSTPRYDHLQRRYIKREIAAAESGNFPDSVDVSWPTDEIVQLLVYFNADQRDQATGAYLLALGVQELARQLDLYDNPSYRSFLIAFKQAMRFIWLQKDP